MKTKNILEVIAFILVASIMYNAVQKRRKKPPIFLRKSLARNYNARTIPPFGIYLKENEKNNKALLEHEFVHWEQYREKGLINFYLDYAKELKKYGYDKMPMEKEARKNESEYCKSNYTECVRKGQSNTIFNPNFRA